MQATYPSCSPPILESPGRAFIYYCDCMYATAAREDGQCHHKMAVNAIAPVIPTSCNQLNVQTGDLLSPKGGQQTFKVVVHSHPLLQAQTTCRYFSSASQQDCVSLSFATIAITLQVQQTIRVFQASSIQSACSLPVLQGEEENFASQPSRRMTDDHVDGMGLFIRARLNLNCVSTTPHQPSGQTKARLAARGRRGEAVVDSPSIKHPHFLCFILFSQWQP